MTPVNCDEAERAVLDVAYGEAERERVVELEAHYASCSTCAEALAKVKRGVSLGRNLTREAAPSMAVVMQAARERAAAIRAAKAADLEPPLTREIAGEVRDRTSLGKSREASPVHDFFAWLGRIAMGPQLGVATVLLVVVGIGLWYLPRLRAPSALEVATLEPDPIPVSETQALLPAVPLQLSHDPRTGRVVAAAEEVPSQRRNEPAAPGSGSERRVRSPTDNVPVEDQRVAILDVPSEETSGAVRAEAMMELPTAAGSLLTGPLPASPVPNPPAMAPQQAQAAHAQDSAQVPAPEGADLGAVALHAEARALAQSNRCAESVNAYQRLLQTYPQYRDGSRASLEMSGCLRTLGRGREARDALARASRSPVAAVAAGARRDLVEMDSEARAAESVPATADSQP